MTMHDEHTGSSGMASGTLSAISTAVSIMSDWPVSAILFHAMSDAVLAKTEESPEVRPDIMTLTNAELTRAVFALIRRYAEQKDTRGTVA